MKTTKEVVEVVSATSEIEKLRAKIAELKELEKAQRLETAKKVAELKEAAKAEKIKKEEEAAKLRAEKMRLMMEAGELQPKVNKSQVIRDLMAAGKSKAQIVEETGYTNKFVLDNMWRIEKSLGLR